MEGSWCWEREASGHERVEGSGRGFVEEPPSPVKSVAMMMVAEQKDGRRMYVEKNSD